jgi:RND family efflux transporter MFP subunit
MARGPAPGLAAALVLCLPVAGAHAQETAPAEAPPRVLLIAAEKANLSSPMSGRVARVAVDAGDRFHKGAVLVEFDCALRELELRKANARLEIAEATLRSNQRLKELQSVGDLELAVSRGERDAAEAEARRVSLEIQYCSLRAPWDGNVVARHVNPLENIALGAPLLEVNSQAAPLAQMLVPSRWLAWLEVGTAFEIEIIETGARYPARVSRRGAQVDAVSQTVEVFGTVEGDPARLLPGMSGSAHFAIPRS